MKAYDTLPSDVEPDTNLDHMRQFSPEVSHEDFYESTDESAWAWLEIVLVAYLGVAIVLAVYLSANW